MDDCGESRDSTSTFFKSANKAVTGSLDTEAAVSTAHSIETLSWAVNVDSFLDGETAGVGPFSSVRSCEVSIWWRETG